MKYREYKITNQASFAFTSRLFYDAHESSIIFQLGKAMFNRLFLYFIFVMCWYNAQSNKEVYSDAWVDPADMLSSDMSSFAAVSCTRN